MANPILITVPRHSDRVLVEAFLKFSDAIGSPHVSVNAGVGGNYQLDSENPIPGELEKLLSYDASVIQGISTSVPGFNVNLHRGGHPSHNQSKSAIYDDIGVQIDNNHCKLSEGKRVEFVGIVTKHLGSFDPQRHVKGGVSEEQDQLLAIHNATLERLEALNENLIRDSEKFRKKVEKDYRDRSADLERKYDERSDQFNAEIEEKRNALIRREEKLAEKTKEIDDRQNTHVRRELRQQILEEIRNRTEEFKLTKGTNNLRWPIHIVCVLLVTVLGSSAFYYAVESIEALRLDQVNNLSLAVLVGKQLLLSGAFGASVIFYIRWMNTWFSQHASTEFQLRQFQLDIERASWVVETALEWKDAKGSTIPAELLGPISNNLFGSESSDTSDLTPADELASALLGTASKVRLNVAGSELELDGKKLNKA